VEDATDTFGGHLPEGSVTYRLFIDMVPGAKLISIYGDAEHPLLISSTQPFFNHREDGVTFGKDINRSRYENGTVPLDTYITLGQCSKSFAQGAYAGVQKEMDDDGSIVGGMNNDGGSAQVPSGLLNNDATEMGLPLTESDGLVLLSNIPGAWVDLGFTDLVSQEDTTIFGSKELKSTFSSTNVLLKNAGTTGPDSLTNEIFIAQLTTKGDLAFELNIEAEIMIDDHPVLVRYVARNQTSGEHEIFEPLLKYPYECGCTDPDYLEASTEFGCTDNSKCMTPVVLGCMDTMACNYDPAANYNVQDICCYIGYCHDLDLSVVCPELRARADLSTQTITILPNPATSTIAVSFEFPHSADIPYQVLDISGRLIGGGVLTKDNISIDISSFQSGYYLLQLKEFTSMVSIPFIKL
jgi:hypothetical protein